MNYFFKHILAISFSLLLLVSCDNKDEVGPPPSQPPTPPPPTTTYVSNLERISQSGGFVSAIAYHPTLPGVVWASGDDTSGLYKSTDGGTTWVLNENLPSNVSAYNIVFDPSDSNKIYAAEHFGRGLMKSVDGGTTWSLLHSGLPTVGSGKRLYDLVVDKDNSNVVLIASDDGVYRSTDSGATFSKVVSGAFTTNSEVAFRAIKQSPSAVIVVGSDNGRIYKSSDSGVNWTEITTASWFPVTNLATSNNALYIAFSDGMITKTTSYSVGDFSIINNTTGTPDIESSQWTKIKVASGANASLDTLYVGSTQKAASTKWGMHVSTDGGSTWSKITTGIENISIFNLAINPSNSNEVIIGTVNYGVYKTTNSGSSWSRSDSGLFALVGIALDILPGNDQHILMSSSVPKSGWSRLLETTDGGSTWSDVSAFQDKNVRAIIFPSTSASEIVVGTSFSGIYRTTTGASGTWNQVNTKTVQFNSIRQDKVNSNILYASSYQDYSGAPATDKGIYVSTNSGASWAQKLNTGIIDIETTPGSEGVAVALTADVYVTSDSFNSTLVALNLNTFSGESELYSAAEFIPGVPSTLLVGSTNGNLYKTSNFNSAGSSITWEKITFPALNVWVNDIYATSANTWYVACWIADGVAKTDSNPGIYKTEDAGTNWTKITSNLLPSQAPYRIKESSSNADIFFTGFWGSGLYKHTLMAQ